MKPMHLVILWHMHQPQYRDPVSRVYMLPWTRLHAIKDYWGMVKVLEEFPGVHATFNMVPALGTQIEEYASGHFREASFEASFANADTLAVDQKEEILAAGVSVESRAHDAAMAAICGAVSTSAIGGKQGGDRAV